LLKYFGKGLHHPTTVWPGFLCKYARQGLICDVCERELDIDDRDRSLPADFLGIGIRIWWLAIWYLRGKDILLGPLSLESCKSSWVAVSGRV
jgi:hypothetical protein